MVSEDGIRVAAGAVGFDDCSTIGTDDVRNDGILVDDDGGTATGLVDG